MHALVHGCHSGRRNGVCNFPQHGEVVGVLVLVQQAVVRFKQHRVTVLQHVLGAQQLLGTLLCSNTSNNTRAGNNDSNSNSDSDSYISIHSTKLREHTPTAWEAGSASPRQYRTRASSDSRTRPDAGSSVPWLAPTAEPASAPSTATL